MCALSTATEPQTNSLLKILLLEDEANVAKGLQLVLGEAGYEVDWAETGKRALELFRHKPYDLMLADLLLPDTDGMEVIKEVRRLWPQTKVIVITGYATVASAIDALKLGALDYVEKPFTENEIKAAINAVWSPAVVLKA
jgi:DNA-binding response OmpR family regulator